MSAPRRPRPTRRPRRFARAGALLGAGALALALPGVAQAERVTVPDADESGTASDVRRVVVNHRAGEDGTGGRVVVRVRAGEVALGDRLDLWLDRPGDRTGVKYVARIAPDSGYGPVERVRGWRTSGPEVCANWGARLTAGPDQVAVFSIPRACLGDPSRVRVAVRVTYRPDGDTYRDWAPGTRRLSDWVAAG